MSDVVVNIAAARSIATVSAFSDVGVVRAALQAQFGAAPPETPGWIESKGVRLSTIAPHRFVVDHAPTDLASRLAGIAAVTDQSDLWHIVTIAGAGAVDILSSLVPVDLRLSAFPVGALALTRGAHVDLRLWRLDIDRFELAMPRSYAPYLAHALPH